MLAFTRPMREGHGAQTRPLVFQDVTRGSGGCECRCWPQAVRQPTPEGRRGRHDSSGGSSRNLHSIVVIRCLYTGCVGHQHFCRHHRFLPKTTPRECPGENNRKQHRAATQRSMWNKFLCGLRHGRLRPPTLHACPHKEHRQNCGLHPNLRVPWDRGERGAQQQRRCTTARVYHHALRSASQHLKDRGTRVSLRRKKTTCEKKRNQITTSAAFLAPYGKALQILERHPRSGHRRHDCEREVSIGRSSFEGCEDHSTFLVQNVKGFCWRPL